MLPQRRDRAERYPASVLRGGARHFWILAAVAAAFLVVVVAAAVISRSEADTVLVAAIGTALIVAWQSLETARAASAAEEGLRGAADSLRVSQVLAIEAERRRLDADAPRLLVRINEPEWPPRVGRQFVGSEPAQLPMGEVFRLPKDATRHLTLRADGFIRNEGERTVRVTMHGMRVEDPAVAAGPGWEVRWTEPGDHDLDIAPGQHERFRFEDDHMTSEWIANSEAAERNEHQPTAGIGAVIATDDLDNGVIDTWEIELSGRPFDRVADEQGSWRLHKNIITGQSPMVARVRPRLRRYYRSKSADQQLPEIELPTGAPSHTPPGSLR